MRVEVEPPAVAGDTVVLRWRQSAANPFQQVNEFFIRYEGIDLAAFSPELFYEVFLGLQLKVFAAYRAPVELVFPTPVPRSTAAYWAAFHDAEHVTIAPIAEHVAYSPWRAVPAPGRKTNPYAVFFGGGKDSTLATCLLSELYGSDRVVLIQFVGPLRVDPALTERIERRQESLMLRPARELLGVATQRVWTDYQAQFRPEGYRARPHLELYTVGALPALLARGVALCTFCITWQSYSIDRDARGRPVYHYAKSRPEVTATQTTHYRRALGVDLTVADVSLPFSHLLAFRFLAERYPHALKQIVMCAQAGIDQRWCYRCLKCVEYALYSLYCGFVDDRFDYDRLFARSPFAHQLAAYAESGVELSPSGNAPWQPFFSLERHFLAICHVVANIGREQDLPPLGRAADANLMLLRALYGNRSFPQVEFIPAPTFAHLGPDLGTRLRSLAAQHVTVVDELPGPHLAGNTPTAYDFRAPMPTPTTLVAHVRG
jgi:hypothetical protein